MLGLKMEVSSSDFSLALLICSRLCCVSSFASAGKNVAFITSLSDAGKNVA